MGIIHWFQSLKKVEPEVDDDKVTTRDLLKFMQDQQKNNNELIKCVLDQSAKQSEVMQTYVDLFKPREVKSTTLNEREAAKQAETQIRPEEWTGIKNLAEFNELTAGFSAKDPEDY